jgi:uncharacterized damage-inducible protein DinB
MAMMLDHLRRMGRYNRWANRRLYAACGALPEAEYLASRPAFFGSIHGTLNHLVVTDRIWLARLRGEPNPGYGLDDRPYPDLASLQAAREAEDEHVIATIDGDSEATIAGDLVYRTVSSPQAEVRTPRHLCWLHLFNHQTHHRGQVHDQLSQTSVPPPPLDLLFYLREVGA